MNKYIILAIGLLLFSCSQEVVQSAENVEDELKAVVEGETNAYMEKDYEKWSSYWDQGDEVLRLDVSDAGFAQVRGWEESGGKLESFFIENPDPITSTYENSNYLIFSDTNLAWVAFDQTWKTTEGEESVAKATITLVRKEGEWKIVSYTAIQYEEGGDDVDTLGRD